MLEPLGLHACQRLECLQRLGIFPLRDKDVGQRLGDRSERASFWQCDLAGLELLLVRGLGRRYLTAVRENFSSFIRLIRRGKRRCPTITKTSGP